MKKAIKIFAIIIAVIVILVIAFILLLIWASKQPAVKDKYYEKISSSAALEKKYLGLGGYETSYTEFTAEKSAYGAYKIWYPSEMSASDTNYPLVVMVNGTGVPASKYEPIFEHLASWGFIVIGNEDESSWSGASSAASLDFILGQNADEQSIFYQKIDENNIGIAGHSQGGVGALNAVTEQANGNRYTAIYTASTTHIVLAEALDWTYSVHKIAIPYFMTAGTGNSDAGDGKDNAGIAPLSSLTENYNAISSEIPKIMARRRNTEHGEMLANADS